jgi:hypothetical protein
MSERTLYVDCRVEVDGWGDEEAFACDDAEVRIEAETIVISYFDEVGIVVLEGSPRAQGGWQLMARSRPRRAFLEPMGDSSSEFVGEIDERGELAGWRLQLGRPVSRA